jgi:DnaJ like chaperone protein
MFAFGKLIGGALGFIMAGPFGALLGVLIGGIFDKSLGQHLSQPYIQFHQEKRENISFAFIKTVACLMGLIAKADGRISENEINFANHIFKQLKLNREQKDKAIQWFTASKNGQISLDDQARMLKHLKDTNLNLCKTCLDIAYQIAKLDGLNPTKIQIMNELLNQSGFVQIDPIFGAENIWQQAYQRTYNQHRNYSSSGYQSPPQKNTITIDQAFRTLNLNVTAEKSEVKKAYRKLMSKYHPDKMIARGASKQELKLATEKTQQISKAYTLICESKGW